MEHNNTPSTTTESKGVLGTVWSAAGAIAETVQHAVQGTIDAAYQTADRIQHEAEPLTQKVIDSASAVYDKTIHTAENLLGTEPEKKVDSADAYFSSPTNDFLAAVKSEPAAEINDEQTPSLQAATEELFDSAKKVVTDAIAKASDMIESTIHPDGEKNSDLKENSQDTNIGGDSKLELTMDIVAHLQRIADRTGDKVLHDTARKAHSACAKGVSDAPGVHLVRVTPEQATELVNLAILTQDHELADFARYCQSVAATTQIGIEPSPGKIMEELNKGRQELNQQGRMHTGPGYGAAFASVNRTPTGLTPSSSSSNIPAQEEQQQQQQQPSTPRQEQSGELQQPATTERVTAAAATEGGMQLTMEMVAHLQRIADRTGDKVLHETARKAHSACAKNLSDAPGVHLVSVNPEQASELVNLAIRTQDVELANFARYCQSVAATTQVGIEPSPGKILEEIEKGRQELQEQGRSHTGPGYGAAFASLSRSNSSQSLSRSNSSSSLSRSNSSQSLGKNSRNSSREASRSSSPTNVPIAPSQEQSELESTSSSQSRQLTMEVVAHLQRIADRTGDALLHETARKAHSACAKNLNEAAGVHLTTITPDQATELVNLAIRTQDPELADFARYCQSVAATTQVGIEPSPGKILEEIEKGRLELQQQGRTHTGPGYGAAFASLSRSNSSQSLSRSNSSKTLNSQPVQMEPKIEGVETINVQALVGQPSQ